MKRREFLGAFAALLTVGSGTVCSALEPAAQNDIIGRNVADDYYELYYRSDLCMKERTHECYYSDRLFDHSSLEYDHQLAKVSFALAAASPASRTSDPYWGVNGFVGRESNLADALEKLGFANAQFPHYDEDLNHTEDITAWAVAQKTVEENGQRTTTFAVIVRSAGYGSKWVSNLHAGEGSEHIGFVTAAQKMSEELREYLNSVAQKMELGKVRLWLCGYSRGAAIGNLVATQLVGMLPGLEKEDVFVYLFGVPSALTAADRPEMQQDYDNNHAPDGTLKPEWGRSNIFNIIASGDPVARMLPEDWGFHRNGNDRYLPATRLAQELQELDAVSAEWTPTARWELPFVFSELATKEETDRVLESIFRECPDRKTFHEKYENALQGMFQSLLYHPEDFVAPKDPLALTLVRERVARVAGMERFSERQLEQSIRSAVELVRPLMGVIRWMFPEWFWVNIAPAVAVGLCYGAEKELVQILLNYTRQTVRERGKWERILSCSKCHYAENYITLLDYYDPEEHGMEPYTKGV